MKPIADWTETELQRVVDQNDYWWSDFAAEVLRLRKERDDLAAFTAEDYPGWYRERAEKAEDEVAYWKRSFEGQMEHTAEHARAYAKALPVVEAALVWVAARELARTKFDVPCTSRSLFDAVDDYRSEQGK